jgi:hypothetical protein
VTRFPVLTLLFTLLMLSSVPLNASAQIVEAVGSRALGMGGAFVAVANDSSATWWNPAGLATGPFFDIAVGGAVTDIDGSLPAGRERGLWFALTTPPFGFSYYRLNITDIGQIRTIGADGGGREDRRAAVPDWSLSASQFGATLVHTVVSGVHVGTTLKYVRAKGLQGELTGPETLSVSEWLDLVDESSGGDVEDNFDLDLGVLAVRGPVRLGGVVRNLREMELGPVKVPRQGRVGVAFDASAMTTRALLVAVDTDIQTYQTPLGNRRVVAVGGEGWVLRRRLGLRAGARFNTTGAEEQAYTAGASVVVRSGMFIDAHVVYGGADDESGWGITGRASF